MLQYEISMPSFYISSFAVSKNTRENQKRGGMEPEEKAAPLRHIQGQEHPRRMLPFQQGFSFHQKQTRPPCFQAAQKTPQRELTQQCPPEPPDPLSATGVGWQGLCPRGTQNCRETTTATRWMEVTPSILLHTSLLFFPPKKEG